jgi:lipoyl(octanoyl) transferase
MLSDRLRSSEHDEPVAEFHLLGLVDYDVCQRLQQRIAATLATQAAPRMVVLLCEHPTLITVGRHGSRQDIRFTQRELERERLAVRWVKRGGGALLHAPGQLAIYPILSLPSRGWTVGAYLDRLQGTLVEVCRALGIATHVDRPGGGVWGRTGLLAAMGVTVQNNTTTHGMFLNVNPGMGWYGFVDTGLAVAGGRATMSCLLAERQRAVRMPEVRSLLMQTMPSIFDCERHYVHSSHVWLETGVACGQVACVR